MTGFPRHERSEQVIGLECVWSDVVVVVGCPQRKAILFNKRRQANGSNEQNQMGLINYSETDGESPFRPFCGGWRRESGRGEQNNNIVTIFGLIFLNANIHSFQKKIVNIYSNPFISSCACLTQLVFLAKFI